ncbi:hypothetical protein M9194_04290 [Vibrio sp. S4M6]|uniref:hypothetical protein n=1 Tax=Vibrio sinus TaxID=2946865 RepID=UPI00202A6DF6|nr:hypothetical protein [Vibrio sinus]MCL9780655.1 hypothetical protein [Vibrio sinus]
MEFKNSLFRTKMRTKEKSNKKGNKKDNKFILASHRLDLSNEDINTKSINQMARGNRNHGRFYCVNEKEKQLVFTKEKGFLLAESIAEYKQHPHKFMYIEKNEDTYTLVSIYNGNVFFDGELDQESQIIGQIEILENLDEIPMTISIFGIEDVSFIDVDSHTISIDVLDSSICSSLKGNKLYLSQDPAERNKRKRVILLLFITVVLSIVVCVIFYLHMKKVEREQELMRQNMKKVDIYQAYKSAMDDYSATYIITNLSKEFTQLNSQIHSAWSIGRIQYQGHKFIFSVMPKKSDSVQISMLLHCVKSLGGVLSWNQSDFGKSGAVITFSPNHKEKKHKLYYITPIKPQVIHYFQSMQMLLKGKITDSNYITRKLSSYKNVEIDTSFNDLSLNVLNYMITNLDHYPAKISSLDITPNNDNGSNYINFNVKLVINFYGE